MKIIYTYSVSKAVSKSSFFLSALTLCVTPFLTTPLMASGMVEDENNFSTASLACSSQSDKHSHSSQSVETTEDFPSFQSFTSISFDDIEKINRENLQKETHSIEINYEDLLNEKNRDFLESLLSENSSHRLVLTFKGRGVITNGRTNYLFYSTKMHGKQESFRDEYMEDYYHTSLNFYSLRETIKNFCGLRGALKAGVLKLTSDHMPKNLKHLAITDPDKCLTGILAAVSLLKNLGNLESFELCDLPCLQKISDMLLFHSDVQRVRLKGLPVLESIGKAFLFNVYKLEVLEMSDLPQLESIGKGSFSRLRNLRKATISALPKLKALDYTFLGSNNINPEEVNKTLLDHKPFSFSMVEAASSTK